MTDTTSADLHEPDNPAAAALAQHIADHPISTIQATFRLLGMRLTFELRNAADDPNGPIPASGNAEDCPRCTDPNPPYPFLCPGHPAEAQQDTVRTVPDTTALRHLVDRAARGVASTDEGQQLRECTEHLLRRIATLEHVAAGNKQHVQLIVPDMQRAEAALARVRAFADRLDADADRIAAGTVHPVAAHIRAALEGPATDGA